MKPDLPYSVVREGGMSDAEYIRHLWKEAHAKRVNAEFLQRMIDENLAEARRIEALAEKLEGKAK
jgi:hypothetical protein